MKEEKYVYCNLCQKNYSDLDFVNHVPVDHLPTVNYVCCKCNVKYTALQNLEDHVNTNHYSEREHVKLKRYDFCNIFADSNDVVQHSKEAPDWISNAFSFGFDNVLNKREMRLLVKDNFTNNSVTDIKNESICKICCELSSETSYCYYCAASFGNRCHLKFHVIKKHLQLPSNLKKIIKLCNICEMVFPNDKYLLKHKKTIHRKRLYKKKLHNIEKDSPFCHFCGKSLANKSNLKRHVMNQHSEEVGISPSNSVFTCDYCKCYFSNKSSVKRHIENLHLRMKDTRKSISCFQCEQRFNSIKNLNAHLTIEHNVTINEEKLQFKNLDEFCDWKQEEEIRTNSRFIQLRGLRRQRRKGEEILTLKFVCNRSGIFHSKSNGKRAYRLKGSSKIGRYCSAYIEIMFKDNLPVNGTYCSTHSGHDNDLRYLTLTMDEKREIYEKIKNGATFSSILNEIRNSVGKEIKRKHLVTNKDLHNIVTTFKKLSKSPSNQGESETETAEPNVVAESENRGGVCGNGNVVVVEQQQPNERTDRNFNNNDLDICADLWVDTYQRIINRFDEHHNQQQQHHQQQRDVCKNDTNSDMFVDEGRVQQQQQHDNRVPAKSNRLFDDATTGNDYGRSLPSSSYTGYTPNGASAANLDACYKPAQQNFAAVYGGHHQDDRLSGGGVDLTYFDGGVSARGLHHQNRNAKEMSNDFCGVMSNINVDGRGGDGVGIVSKEFYIDGNLVNDASMVGDGGNMVPVISAKLAGVCVNAAAYDVAVTIDGSSATADTVVPADDAAAADTYMQNVHVYDDKLALPNVTILAHNGNVFDGGSSYRYENKVMRSVAVDAPEPGCNIQSSPDDDIANSLDYESAVASSDDELLPDTTSTVAEAETAKKTVEISDLRDRVNSVTALYNIVESELDERKKNIIRNYVDNMFRVLQYRYNKCKTKKNKEKKMPPKQKAVGGKRRASAVAGGVRGGKAANEKTKTKILTQHRPTNQYLCSHSHYASSKTANPYSTTLNNTMVNNIRPDINFMKWDHQY